MLGVSASEDGAQLVRDLAQSMVDAEPGNGEETFSEDGASTGGSWDLFPTADVDGLNGMVPQSDQIIFPEEDATESDS